MKENTWTSEYGKSLFILGNIALYIFINWIRIKSEKRVWYISAKEKMVKIYMIY